MVSISCEKRMGGTLESFDDVRESNFDTDNALSTLSAHSAPCARIVDCSFRNTNSALVRPEILSLIDFERQTRKWSMLLLDDGFILPVVEPQYQHTFVIY